MTKLTAATLRRFDDEAQWRRDQRAAALASFRDGGLPDTESEVWKYAPLDELRVDELTWAEPSQPSPTPARLEAVPSELAATIEVAEGGARLVGTGHPGVRVEVADPPPELGALVGPEDAFSSLNLALTPGCVVVDVAEGATIERPVALRVTSTAGASFPRVLVRLGAGSSVRLVEHLAGHGAQLVAGVAEYVVGEAASLEVSTVQSLGFETWSLWRTCASLGRDATFTQLVVGLGAHYDRVRADARLEGEGASSTLYTAHVGTGDQVHDLRTMQVHLGRRTTSRLYSRAAVSGRAESIYSGLISMRHGAKRADARQANQSLVLSDGARADAVPNLDIQENDVRCSHASSVGPVDAEQRWYLESRGVEPHDAVRLIIAGFFSEVAGMLRDDVLAGELRTAIGRLESDMGPVQP